MEVPHLPTGLYVLWHGPRCILGQPLTYICADFKNELYFIGAAIFYLAFYFIGKKTNARRANKWCVFNLSDPPRTCYVDLIGVRGPVLGLKRTSLSIKRNSPDPPMPRVSCQVSFAHLAHPPHF